LINQVNFAGYPYWEWRQLSVLLLQRPIRLTPRRQIWGGVSRRFPMNRVKFVRTWTNFMYNKRKSARMLVQSILPPFMFSAAMA